MKITDYLQDDYLEEIEISDKDISLVTSSQLYTNDIKKYPLLTKEEEQKYGTYLKLYPQIEKLISKRKIKGNIEPILNLEQILSSITTYQEKDYITSTLINYYIQYGRKEAENDKAVMYYLQEYNKLTKELDHIPTPEELTTYFSKPNKYNLFIDFTNVTKIPGKDLMIKIFYYIKYTLAKTIMINSNQRLVANIAHKYNNLISYNNVELSDLIAEGNIGLAKAVEKFDVDKGNKFSTYAHNWITSHILKAIREQNNSIRMPRNIYYKNKNYLDQIKELEQLYGKHPTEQEIKDKLSISDDDFNLLLKRKVISLDAKIESLEDSYSSLIETIPGSRNVEEEFKIKYFKENIESVLSNLTEQEQIVLRKRYPLDERKIQTLEATGQELGVTKERVRQIEKKALIKSRRSKYTIPLTNK